LDEEEEEEEDEEGAQVVVIGKPQLETEEEDVSLQRRSVQTPPSVVDTKAQAPVATSGSLGRQLLFAVYAVARQLGLTFLFVKALGWAVFLVVYVSSVGGGALDAAALTATVNKIVPQLNHLVATGLPKSVGACDPGLYRDQATWGEPPPTPCEGGSSALREVDFSPYTVIVRWVTGINSLQVDAVNVSAPGDGAVVVGFRGRFDRLTVSLHGKGTWKVVPDFDSIPSWDHIGWTAQVSMDCHPSFPFLSQPRISQLHIEDSMEVPIALFGVKLTSRDIAATFGEAVNSTLSMVLREQSPDSLKIRWAGEELDIIRVLNRLVELNLSPEMDHLNCNAQPGPGQPGLDG